MKIVFYTTHCPQCKVLESKLKQKGISYTKEEDTQKIFNLGLRTMPALKVEGQLMTFIEAIKWVNSQEGNI